LLSFESISETEALKNWPRGSQKAWCSNARGHNGFKLQAVSLSPFLLLYGETGLCPSSQSSLCSPALTPCFWHQGAGETGEQGVQLRKEFPTRW